MKITYMFKNKTKKKEGKSGPVQVEKNNWEVIYHPLIQGQWNYYRFTLGQ